MTHKSFHFTDDTDIITISCSSSDSLCSESDLHVCSQNCLNIKIEEVLDPSFGMYVWPCAPVLGKYVWQNRSRLKDKTTVELGSGTGFVSVIAAKCGAHVIITDSKNCSSTFKIAEYNMKLNEIEADKYELEELTWGYATPFLINMRHVDVIFGSDVFYCSKDFEDIIVTVSYLLKLNFGAEFWCSYEHRCSEWNIDHLLKKWSLSCEEVPLESFGADGFNIAGHDLPALISLEPFAAKYHSRLYAFGDSLPGRYIVGYAKYPQDLSFFKSWLSFQLLSVKLF